VVHSALWDRLRDRAELRGDLLRECVQDGLVALELPETQVNDLAGELESEDCAPQVAVDLETKTIAYPTGRRIVFEMDEVRRTALLEGLDELQTILREEASIAAFQSRARSERPWQYPTVPAGPER